MGRRGERLLHDLLTTLLCTLPFDSGRGGGGGKRVAVPAPAHPGERGSGQGARVRAYHHGPARGSVVFFEVEQLSPWAQEMVANYHQLVTRALGGLPVLRLDKTHTT